MEWILPLERPDSTAPHDEQIGLAVGGDLADLLLGVTHHHLRLHLYLQDTIPINEHPKQSKQLLARTRHVIPLTFFSEQILSA
jgi:hypothetical protein